MLSIVLKRQDFREADQYITLLTAEQGKQECLARGVKKSLSKLSGLLEPPALVEVELVPGKEHTIITGVEPIELFKGIRSDLVKSAVVGYILAFVDAHIATGERDQRLFRLLESWLIFLEKKISAQEMQNSTSFVDGFMVQAIVLLGFEPELGICVNGGEAIDLEKPVFFATSLGGVLCASCLMQKKNTQPLGLFLPPQNSVQLKKLFEIDSWEQISTFKVSPLTKEAVYQFSEYHLGKKIPRLVTW